MAELNMDAFIEGFTKIAFSWQDALTSGALSGLGAGGLTAALKGGIGRDAGIAAGAGALGGGLLGGLYGEPEPEHRLHPDLTPEDIEMLRQMGALA